MVSINIQRSVGVCRWVWIVRVMENIGGRLLLRFEGTDKAKDDFWLFYLHHRLHPIGWCRDNDAIYKPPEGTTLTPMLMMIDRQMTIF